MNQLLLLVTLAFWTTLALAINEFSPRGENRLLRQESRSEKRESRELRDAAFAALEKVQKAEPKWSASIGVAYTDGDDGSNTWSTPFVLDRLLGGGDTVRLSGDGWTRVEPDAGDTRRGFADVGIAYRFVLLKSEEQTGPDGKPLPGDKWSWRGDAGIVVPTGGEIGSSDGKQRAGSSFRYEHDKWTGSVGARLTRLSGPIRENSSRVGRSGLVGLGYTFAEDTEASVELSRSYRPGASGATEVSAGYQWPFAALNRKFSGTLTLTRGLSKGARDTGLEFDLGFSF